MKIWIGTEKEDNINKQTLFICSDSIAFDSLQTILELANKYKVNRLYFGAGRVNTFFATKLDSLKDFEVVVEIGVTEEYWLPDLLDNISVVFSIRDENLTGKYENSVCKIDNYKNAVMFKKDITIDICNINNDMYPDDVVIYEDKD